MMTAQWSEAAAAATEARVARAKVFIVVERVWVFYYYKSMRLHFHIYVCLYRI